jgi:hypothetical protein
VSSAGGAVLDHGLSAIDAACAEALAAGIASGDVILTVLARRRRPEMPPSITTVFRIYRHRCIQHVGRNGFAEVAGSEVGVGSVGVSLWYRRARGSSAEHQQRETTMSPLRARMIEDMSLAGLALGTQKIYTQAVYRLAVHYRRSPDQLNEEEVRSYLLSLCQRGVARGTFKTGQYGLRFLYRHTLGRAWGLFGEKKDCRATAETAA